MSSSCVASLKMHKIVVIFLSLLAICACFSYETNEEPLGVFGKLKSGLKLAGQILGLDKASEVAKLVTDSFAKPQRKGDSGQSGTNIFSGFFRLLGLETNKIGAIAINVIVFLSQLISSTLSRPQIELVRARNYQPQSPFDWILNNSNEKISEILKFAKDPDLPNLVVKYLKEISSDEETGCVQLLICKSAPFLWGMQKALEKDSSKTQASDASSMFRHLPTIQEIANNGDECEKKYTTCLLN